MTIENGDLPASPSSLDITEYAGTINCSYNKPLTGLTKREAFAMSAIQGWLARCANVPHHATLEPEVMASVAVSMADALLKELDK